jgi:small multidrug resistance family-3 protein
MTPLAWVVFTAAALFEVIGNAVIRQGLSRRNSLGVMGGMLALGIYGLVVNKVKWDFSKLLGVYIAFFAIVSVLFGRIVFHETVPRATWIGLLLIVVGALVIEFGGTVS